MPRFSLIVATFNRSDELLVLLGSLAQQQTFDCELIIVDQNRDDRVTRVLSRWSSIIDGQRDAQGKFINVKHLRSAVGASRARNLGLLHSTGEILAFPDDDSWYQPDTLTTVDTWFRRNREYGFLSLGCRDEQGRITSNAWWQAECDINWINSFRTTATCCYFVRRPAVGIEISFDESIGPGSSTIFGSGEDTDFILGLMHQGIRGRFCSTIYVGHPLRNGFVDGRRAMLYGGGFGRVLAKHSCPFLFAGFVMFDFARAFIYRVGGNRSRSSQLWNHGKGMIRAYFSK